jgi:hypothetical protein
MNELHSVVSVKVKTGFILDLAFEDGKTFTLDFKPWIDSETGWLFDPVKDPAFFARVFVHGGTLEWPNGLDICADGLRAWCEQAAFRCPSITKTARLRLAGRVPAGNFIHSVKQKPPALQGDCFCMPHHQRAPLFEKRNCNL